MKVQGQTTSRADEPVIQQTPGKGKEPRETATVVAVCFYPTNGQGMDVDESRFKTLAYKSIQHTLLNKKKHKAITPKHSIKPNFIRHFKRFTGASVIFIALQTNASILTVSP